MWWLLRYSLLGIILLTGSFLYMMEAIGEWMRQRPKAVLFGMNPIGAASVVRLWAKGLIAVTSRGRRPIARYVRKNHPKVYRKLRGMLVP